MTVHQIDWKNSIVEQLQTRKTIQQLPFEDICSLVCSLFEKVDECKLENQHQRQEYLQLQNQILYGGSDAAFKSKLAELEAKDKEILELKKAKNSELEEKDREIKRLRDALDKLNQVNKTVTDEHIALHLTHTHLEKSHRKLTIECEALRKQILAIKKEDADRLNAENDRLMRLQQERARKELESNVANYEVVRGRLGSTLARDTADIDDDDLVITTLNAQSRCPEGVEFSYDAHEGEASAIHWYHTGGPKDDYLATGGFDRKVKIWRIVNGSESPVATLLGSNASVNSIDAQSDFILASCNDHASRIWSIVDQRLKGTLTGHSNKVFTAKFLGVPNKVASGSQDRTIKTWDINQGACLKTYFAGSWCFDLVYNSYTVMSGHFDSKIRFWDLRKPNENESTAQILLQSKITSLDVSRDGMKLICSLRDNTIKSLDLRRMEVSQTYSDEKFKIGSDTCRARLSPDGQHLACGSSDGSIYVWDANTSKLVKCLSSHQATILACCWSPDGGRIASIEKGKRVSIWA